MRGAGRGDAGAWMDEWQGWGMCGGRSGAERGHGGGRAWGQGRPGPGASSHDTATPHPSPRCNRMSGWGAGRAEPGRAQHVRLRTSRFGSGTAEHAASNSAQLGSGQIRAAHLADPPFPPPSYGSQKGRSPENARGLSSE